MIKNKKFEMNMQKKLKNFTAKPDLISLECCFKICT